MNKLQQLEERLEKVQDRIWVLELADRLVGENRNEWYRKCAERNHLIREIRELKGF